MVKWVSISLGIALLIPSLAVRDEPLDTDTPSNASAAPIKSKTVENIGIEPTPEAGTLSPARVKDLRLYGALPEINEADWFDPWHVRESWDISFELGLTGNRGNSQTFNIQSGLELEQKR